MGCHRHHSPQVNNLDATGSLSDSTQDPMNLSSASIYEGHIEAWNKLIPTLSDMTMQPLFGADLSHLLKFPFRKRRFSEPHICLEPDLLDSFTKLDQITFKNPEEGLIAAECGHATPIQTETDLYVIVSICPAYVWDQQGKSNYLTFNSLF